MNTVKNVYSPSGMPYSTEGTDLVNEIDCPRCKYGTLDPVRNKEGHVVSWICIDCEHEFNKNIKSFTMQCKDIPVKPILDYLLKHKGQWCGWWGEERNVALSMPVGTPDKLVLAKMKQLIKRGLVEGCACGCRGDFCITAKGEQYLNLNETK